MQIVLLWWFFMFKRIIAMKNAIKYQETVETQQQGEQSQEQNHFSFDFSLNIKGKGKNISGKKMFLGFVTTLIVCVFVILLFVVRIISFP